MEVVERRTTFKDAFSVVDEVLLCGVQGISDIILVGGLINVDFADVKTIMQSSGSALGRRGIRLSARPRLILLRKCCLRHCIRPESTWMPSSAQPWKREAAGWAWCPSYFLRQA